MIYPLPNPVPANFCYTSLRIENITYDGTQYTADVFGMVDATPVPLIYKSSSGQLHQVGRYSITDEDINAMLAAHPDMPATDRMAAAMAVAVERLYEAVNS